VSDGRDWRLRHLPAFDPVAAAVIEAMLSGRTVDLAEY
jgi:hypothetical protein